MALTVIFVLIGSLILSLTLMPVLASLLLPKTSRRARRAAGARGTPHLSAGVATGALSFRYARAGRGGGRCWPSRFCIALHVGLRVRAATFRRGRRDRHRPAAGTSLEESVRINTRWNRCCWPSFPTRSRTSGAASARPRWPPTPAASRRPTCSSRSSLAKTGRRPTTQAELVELMEHEVGDIPGQINWFTQPIEQRINEMISGVRSDVAIKLFGDDFDTLMPKARELENVLRDVPGCADLATEQIAGQPILQIRINQDQIARYGVPAERCSTWSNRSAARRWARSSKDNCGFRSSSGCPRHCATNPDAIADILVRDAARRADSAVAAGRIRRSRRAENDLARMGQAPHHDPMQRPRPRRGQLRRRGAAEDRRARSKLPERAIASNGAASSRTCSGPRSG